MLTAKEVETERNKANYDFIRTSMQMSKDELDAANEVADQKNKEIIKGIIDPTPGLFIDDELKPNEQNFQNRTDNVFKIPPQVQQQLNETVFKKTKKPIIQPTPPEIIPNVVPETEDFFINAGEFDSFKKPEPITINNGQSKSNKYDDLIMISNNDEVKISKSLVETGIKIKINLKWKKIKTENHIKN